MIKDYQQWVKQKLTLQPELRDNNERLYYNYLIEIGYDVSNTSVQQFLKDMSERKIPYIDSVGRASRKIQEEFVHLRGKSYTERKLKKEKQVREEIINWKK